jgi:hypothetical protein
MANLPVDSAHVSLLDMPEEEPMTAQPSMPANPREPRRTSKAVNLVVHQVSHITANQTYLIVSTSQPSPMGVRDLLHSPETPEGRRGIRVTLVTTTVAPLNLLTSARISLPLNQSPITTVTPLPLKKLNGLREGSIVLKWPS